MAIRHLWIQEADALIAVEYVTIKGIFLGAFVTVFSKSVTTNLERYGEFLLDINILFKSNNMNKPGLDLRFLFQLELPSVLLCDPANNSI